MDINEMRIDLSIRGKNGIGFLLAAAIIWLFVTMIFLLPIGIYQKNIFMLFITGGMFPLSIAVSNVIKADWKLKGNPLANLGIYLNFAQVIYFPILFWAIGKSPENAVMIFAIITVAHFFPYGWLYKAKNYTIMAPTASVGLVIVGWNVPPDGLWVIPLCMMILLLILSWLLQMDYKKKVG